VKDFFARFHKRLTPFADIGFWVLTVLSLVPLMIINPPMALTLLQWCAFFLALAGASIVICRILLPQVDLSEWLEVIRKGYPGAVPAAIVFAATVFLLSSVLLAMVLWAKA
jgi:heme/copper-type cytochrome/quinol oxidase subunit 1